MLGEFVGPANSLSSRRVWPGLSGTGGPGELQGQCGFLVLWAPRGPISSSLQLTPFRGDHENESHGGLGGGGRPRLNSVHRRLDRTGLEFLVSSSTKAAFQFQGVGLAGAESPSALLKQLCPVPRLPFDSGHNLGPAVVPEPPRFLGSFSHARDHHRGLWVFGFRVIFLDRFRLSV